MLRPMWTVLLLRTMVADEQLRIGIRKIPSRPVGYPRLEERIVWSQPESSNSMSARICVRSIASMAQNFRSTCGAVRGAPECSTQLLPAATPHVGQGTED